jgi:hypothetical protein
MDVGIYVARQKPAAGKVDDGGIRGRLLRGAPNRHNPPILNQNSRIPDWLVGDTINHVRVLEDYSVRPCALRQQATGL